MYRAFWAEIRHTCMSHDHMSEGIDLSVISCVYSLMVCRLSAGCAAAVLITQRLDYSLPRSAPRKQSSHEFSFLFNLTKNWTEPGVVFVRVESNNASPSSFCFKHIFLIRSAVLLKLLNPAFKTLRHVRTVMSKKTRVHCNPLPQCTAWEKRIKAYVFF